jgi:pimeloyl-ACP methyl ester carboxylesterase
VGARAYLEGLTPFAQRTTAMRIIAALDYDGYGDGPAVIFIGGAASYRAIDEATTQTARRLAAEGFTTVDYGRRGRGRSGDTQPWALGREVEDVAALITAVGGAAALCTNSSGADSALAAASAGVGVTALALYEPPFFAGLSFTTHLDALRLLLADGNNDQAMRYNLTTVIGMPAEAVDGNGARALVGRDGRGRPDLLQPRQHGDTTST